MWYVLPSHILVDEPLSSIIHNGEILDATYYPPVYTIVDCHYDQHHHCAESSDDVEYESEYDCTAPLSRVDDIECLLAYLMIHLGVKTEAVLANSASIRCLTCYVCTSTEELSPNINTKGYGGNESTPF